MKTLILIALLALTACHDETPKMCIHNMVQEYKNGTWQSYEEMPCNGEFINQ